MDARLEDRLKKWHKTIEDVKGKEIIYFELEASEKSFFASIVLKQEGRSMTEKEFKALAEKEWKVFSKGLSLSKSDYLHTKRLLDLQIKCFDAEYISYKIENDAIRQ